MSEPIKQCDAAVIGGGVIGCAIAWRLAQAGLRVIVIERGDVGHSASYAAGGMLAPQAEADGTDDFFTLAVASRAMFPDFSRELQEASGIDIEYRTEGTLYLALTEEDEEELDRRWQWQHSAGLNVKRLNAKDARQLEPLINEKLRWALMFPDDHQVNNRRLMTALHQAASDGGVEFWSHTEALQLFLGGEAGRKRITGLSTSRGQIESSWAIIAAGSWSSLLALDGRRRLDHLFIEPVRGQMVSLEMPAPSVRHIIYSSQAYLIPRFGGFLIAGSTSEHAGYDTRVTAGGIASIVERVAQIMPAVKGLAVTEMWAGLRPRSADDLPVLGPEPDVQGLIYATGHYRNGILLTPITAKVISELIINGQSSIGLAPFSPERFSLRQAAR